MTVRVVSLRDALALACVRVSRLGLGEAYLSNIQEKARRLEKPSNDTLRFMVSTPMPYFETQTRSTELGIFCRGCELLYKGSEHRWSNCVDYKRALQTAYIKKDYSRHLETCEAAKWLQEIFVRNGKCMEHLQGNPLRWSYLPMSEWRSRFPELWIHSITRMFSNFL